MLGGGWWISRDEPSKRQRGLLVLVLGWGLALIHLWSSGLWLWELNESWDPRPVAADIRRLPAGEPVWLEGPTLLNLARRGLAMPAGHDAGALSQKRPTAIRTLAGEPSPTQRLSLAGTGPTRQLASDSDR